MLCLLESLSSFECMCHPDMNMALVRSFLKPDPPFAPDLNIARCFVNIPPAGVIGVLVGLEACSNAHAIPVRGEATAYLGSLSTLFECHMQLPTTAMYH